MTNKPTESKLNVELIKQLHNLEDKRIALEANGLPVPTPQEVMFPIPAILLRNNDVDAIKFITTAGMLAREKSLGLKVKMESGNPVVMPNGEKTAMNEVVFQVTEDTDINAVEHFLATLN